MKARLWLSSLLLVAAACATAPPRAPVITPPAAPTYIVDVRVYEGAIDESPAGHKAAGATVTMGDHTVTTDGAGNVAIDRLAGGSYEVCAEQPRWKRACVTATLPLPPGGDIRISLERDVAPIQALRADGKIFRTADGAAWRWKGVSAFALLDRFAKGEDLGPFLEAYQGYNLLRVWPYVPAKDWGARAWASPAPDVVVRFLEEMGRRGWYVELTLLTDDDPARIPQAKQLVDALVAARPPNVLVEIGNEPQAHKSINTRALQDVLERSGFLYASGDSSALAFGSYVTTHTARTPDWPRRAHDLLEYWTGGGPDAPSDPAHKVPAVADEPGKIQDVGADPAAWRAYFGACALFGAGATFHSETGKFGLPPTDDERRMAAIALEAMNAFPADAPLGAYRRIVEAGQPDTARTYVIGSFMVRSQQRGTAAPEPGWTPLDADGVLWKR